MPDLMPQQISTLCDIGEFDLADRSHRNQPDIDVLLDGDFIAETANHPGSRYELTAKGTQFLTERGVGLNEA